jgi:hypothetical protein
MPRSLLGKSLSAHSFSAKLLPLVLLLGQAVPGYGADPPSVEPGATSYTTADTVVVAVSNGPGNAKDWVGIYAPGSPDTTVVQWKYVGGGAEYHAFLHWHSYRNL